MYTVSDAVEMGRAHELILFVHKWEPCMSDDFDPWTCFCEEYFDE